MGVRAHNERYPKYSHKNFAGPMPKWMRKFGHHLERVDTRQILKEEDGEPIGNRRDIKGRIHWMWY